MRVFVEVKNPLLCLMSENVVNEEQDLICLNCEIVCGYRTEKIRRVKDELKNNYREISRLLETVKDPAQKERFTKKLIEDKNETYSLKISLIDICPFVSNRKTILEMNKIKQPRRKLMDNFMFTYEYNEILRYYPENQYIKYYNTIIDLNKINIRLTYRVLSL